MQDNWVSMHIAKSRPAWEIISYPVGYVAISRPDNDSIYIEDIFVNPEVPEEQWVPWLLSQVTDIAKLEGKVYLYTDLIPSAPNAVDMDKLMVDYGLRKLWTSPIIDIYRKVI
jgi:hypothetical protein